MTLGGLALAVGILVDDATVEIENINRNPRRRQGKLRTAILDGAQQIAVPALVSTLCICIVFLPMFFLAGVSRYLFVPLAEAVVFAMLALLHPVAHDRADHGAVICLRCMTSTPVPLAEASSPASSVASSISSRKVRSSYEDLLERLVAMRTIFIPVFLLLLPVYVPAGPVPRPELLSQLGHRSFILHLRAKSGTRIEETARLCDLVEQSIRKTVPASEMDNILDNIGLPYSTLNLQHATSGLIGPGDGDILVSLKEDHHPNRGLHRGAAHQPAARLPRRHLLLPALGYCHADPQLRPARTHRRAV